MLQQYYDMMAKLITDGTHYKYLEEPHTLLDDSYLCDFRHCTLFYINVFKIDIIYIIFTFSDIIHYFCQN